MKRKGAVKAGGLFLTIVSIVLVTGVTSTAKADWSRVDIGGGSVRRYLFDVNNDGRLDSISTTHWWRNPGDGSGNWQSFSIGNIDYPNPDARIVGDVNGDGLVDLVIGVGRGHPAPYRNRIYAFINPGTTGTWARFHIGTLPDAPDGVETVAIGDMDRDGHPDILAGGECTELWWFINPGPIMTNNWSHHIVADFNVDVEGMVIAHFNEDNFLDIAVTTCHPWGLSGGTYVLINPQIRAGNWLRITVDGARFSAIESIAAGDINRDGWNDVILSNSQPGVNSYLFWYEQPRTGIVWSRRTIDTLSTEHLKGSLPGVADINLDGKPDVVVFRHGSLATYWYRNPPGDGNWVRNRISGTNIGEFAIGDVDNDNDPDIIGGGFWYINPSPNTVPVNLTVAPPPVPANGCFIATAAFGIPMAEEVVVLRKFRDQYMVTNELGRRFVALYYWHSPALAEYISGREWVKRLVRIALKPLLWFSRLVTKD